MKQVLIFALLIINIAVTAQDNTSIKTIYDFTVKDIAGQDFPLSQLKGKKVMIVNTASECGLTPQYESLQALYTAHSEKGFVIIGFPANNFMSQEPGNNEEIATFCQKNYGVSFPMMSKIDVTGDNQHELYQYLTSKTLNGKEDSEVQWNFQKYLVNEDGHLVTVISPKVSPDDAEILNWIKG